MEVCLKKGSRQPNKDPVDVILNAVCLEEEHLGEAVAQPSAWKRRADDMGGS